MSQRAANRVSGAFTRRIFLSRCASGRVGPVRQQPCAGPPNPEILGGPALAARACPTLHLQLAIFVTAFLAILGFALASARAEEVDSKAPVTVRDVTFDDIKFEMKKEDPFERKMLTAKIEKLDGAKIRIRGYIRPSFQQSGITQFILVRDNQECCFGPGAYLFDCIVVEMQQGSSIDYTLRPVAVEGTFSVKEIVGPGKKHLAIYHLSGEKVK